MAEIKRCEAAGATTAAVAMAYVCINDVTHALGAFVEACKGDADLRARVAGRLPQVLATFPIRP